MKFNFTACNSILVTAECDVTRRADREDAPSPFKRVEPGKEIALAVRFPAGSQISNLIQNIILPHQSYFRNILCHKVQGPVVQSPIKLILG